jgi:folylpolyglutamate synthase/dihydropteroate synthase
MISQFGSSNLNLLLGVLSDKAYTEIIKLIYPHFNKIVITEPLNDRKLNGEKVAQEFARYDKKVTIKKNISSAYEFCLKNLNSSDTLLVMGSHFLIGPLMMNLQKKHLTSE